MNKLTEVSVKNGYKATCNHYCKLAYPLSLILLIFSLTLTAQAKYSGGTGDSNNPYLIADANNMNEIGLHPEDFDKHFLMINDIDLSGYTGTEFNIIAADPNSENDWFDGTVFKGVFDGNSFTISNFSYDSNGNGDDYIGIFGFVQGTLNPNAAIKNVILIDPNVIAERGSAVGTLIGSLEDCPVSGCGVIGANVIGGVHVGGLMGDSWVGTVTDCFAVGDISGESYVGGLMGNNMFAGYIERCYAIGSVSAASEECAGGLVGFVGGLSSLPWRPCCEVNDCYAQVSVTGVTMVGGLVGQNLDGNIGNSYASGKVSGSGQVGGLIGQSADGPAPVTYVSCFWDRNINPSLIGIGGGSSDPNVIAGTTAQMQVEETFSRAGWDFVKIWDIGENQTYPYLRVYPAGDLNHDGVVNLPDFTILADHWLVGVE